MFPLIQLPRKSEDEVSFDVHEDWIVSINSTSEEVRRFIAPQPKVFHFQVSINSTSEEVRREYLYFTSSITSRFPLIQLPRKSEAVWFFINDGGNRFRVSINSTSEEVRSILPRSSIWKNEFPLIQLPRKSEVTGAVGFVCIIFGFPLIQLPRKSEACFRFYRRTHRTLFPLIQLPRKSEEWGSENLAPRGL